METEIKTKEQPLFTIKTIKKKHAEQLRETAAHSETDFAEQELLGQIPVWSAVLTKHKTTGHYRVVPIHRYADWLSRTTELSPSDAYRQAHELEQLFLD